MRRSGNIIIGALLGVGALAFAGCGGDSSADARVITIDGGDDIIDGGAEIDAGDVVTYSGSISIQEVTVAEHPELGSGVQVTAGFSPSTYKAATIEGPLIGGCSAYEYSPADIEAEPGLDEGVIQITHMPNTDGQFQVEFPPCAFVAAAADYLCIADAGAGATTVVPGTGGNGIPPGAALVMITGKDFSTADQGRYLSLGGLGAGNNGDFPIIMFTNVPANGVIIGNPGAQAEAGVNGQYVVVAGAGPIPPADPANPFDWLHDDDGLTVQFTPGAGSHFAAFTKSFAPGGGIGDAFTLDDASASRITNVPADGTAFFISCDGADGNDTSGACGTATGSILTVSTSDGDVTGLPDFFMPALVTKRVSVTCTSLGNDHSLEVGTDIAALIDASDPTRIRTTYLRSNLTQSGSINIVAGHGIVGFTTVPGAAAR
jgi:hypothetical protein